MEKFTQFLFRFSSLNRVYLYENMDLYKYPRVAFAYQEL